MIAGAELILFLAFLSLATAPATEVKMVGTALGAGILLDATIVRAMLVPAVVSLLRRAAWWVPGRRRRPGPPPGNDSTRMAPSGDARTSEAALAFRVNQHMHSPEG